MEIVVSPPDSVRAGVGGADDVAAQLVPTWKTCLKQAVRDPAQLLSLLDLPRELLPAAIRAARDFPLFVPLGYVARMRKGQLADPLLRQVLPLAEELNDDVGFEEDPVGDLHAQRAPGMLQKYARRALLITTGACAVHCRYCFRRHFPYDEAPRSLRDWEPALDAIAADETLDEVILSGGDPLTLVDTHLAALTARLAAIPHLARLRVHTRLPILIPERVTGELLDWLCGSRLTPIMVVHANHPQEIDGSVEFALCRLVDAGIPVLNQAVLLRGVNDDADTLAELATRLVNLRVMPYYLHQLDRVRGAAHFEVPLERGRELIGELRRRLPGYAVPQYVQEIAGEASKSPL